MIVSRRAILLALASTPFLAIGATQQPRKRIAIFAAEEEREARKEYGGVLKTLAARGYVQDRQMDLFLDFHKPRSENESGSDYFAALPNRANAIVAWKPDVIVTQGTIWTEALLRVTKTIPIVTSVYDPVGSGYAASLARPGGNVTGLSQGGPEVVAKVMEVLKILAPGERRIAIVTTDNVKVRGSLMIASIAERAAKAAGFDVLLVPAGGRIGEDPRFFRGIASRGVHAAYLAWIPGGDAAVAREAMRASIAIVGFSEAFVEAGALACVSAIEQNFDERVADIVVKIFGGQNPAEIPIEFPQRFRFVLNARTAKALGIKVTPDMLLRADRVID